MDRNNSWFKRLGASSFVLIPFLLSSCGATASSKTSSTHPSTTISLSPNQSPVQSEVGPAKWLNISNSGIDFLQWKNGFGTESIISTSGSAPNETTVVSSNSISITIKGSRVTLSGASSGQSIHGGFAHGALVLNEQQNNGTYASVNYVSASVKQYNRAVLLFNKQINSTNTNVAAAQVKENALQTAVSVVNTDVSSLSFDVSLIAPSSSTVSSFNRDLTTQKNDLATTLKNEQKTLGLPKSDSWNVCSDAATVYVNSDMVSADASAGIGTDADAVEAGMQIIQDEISQLQSDITTLSQTQAAIPSYHGGASGAISAANSEISQANNVLQSALSTSNNSIDTANTNAAQAYQYAVQTNNYANCGSSPIASSPVSHISIPNG